VFTIEPGIYFIDFLMDELRQGEHGGKVDWRLADALAVLGGVRIEDDLVVTNDALVHRNLTRELLPVGGGEA
jgi:Xaa-Pro dipeptidase